MERWWRRDCVLECVRVWSEGGQTFYCVGSMRKSVCVVSSVADVLESVRVWCEGGRTLYCDSSMRKSVCCIKRVRVCVFVI